VNAAVIVTLILITGIAGYGASAPADWRAFIITLIAGGAAFCWLGPGRQRPDPAVDRDQAREGRVRWAVLRCPS
jgi:hypothetical protein